jgi:hypothetical protein
MVPSAAPRRGLRGAAWIAVVVTLFFAAVAFIQIRAALRVAGTRPVGDGKHVETYGFDLANLAVPRDLVVASGMPRDGLRPLVAPPLLTPARVDSLNRAIRGKYLTPDDRVIGVVLAGVARAYPVRVLDWHEVALDTLGGVPIAVCWHALSGSAVVLDRRHEGQVLSLGVSGLLYASHHLLHDRESESLWAPLLGLAVAGPDAGDTLAFVPHVLTRWDTWCAAQPATTVPDPADSLRESYERSPYVNYDGADILRFPVPPLPPLGPGERLKDPLALTRDAAGVWSARPADDGPALAHADRFAWQAIVQSQRLRRK